MSILFLSICRIYQCATIMDICQYLINIFISISAVVDLLISFYYLSSDSCMNGMCLLVDFDFCLKEIHAYGYASKL